MRNPVPALVAGSIALVSLAMLTSCAASSTESAKAATLHNDALILIVASHANVPAPGLPRALEPVVKSAISNDAPVVIIGLDGSPTIAHTFEGFSVDTDNDNARADDIEGYTAGVTSTIDSLEADSDGSDLSGALFIARDKATALGASAPAIVIVDSGLPDTGAIDMTVPGITIADPAEIAAGIIEGGRLPVLAGADVYLVGFGYVASPQPDLTPRQRDNVTELWRAALTGVGASVTVIPEPRAGAGGDTHFTTGLVEVAAEPPIEPGPETLVYGQGSSLAFVSDSGTFLDPDAADATLDDLAEWLTASPGRSAHITGTTANVDSFEAQLGVAAQRVAAVADGLIARGVSDDQIRRSSVGSQWPGYTPDHRADGSLDEAAAALNRTTQIELIGR